MVSDVLIITVFNENNENEKIPIVIGEYSIFNQKLQNLQKPFTGYINLITREEKIIGYIQVRIEKSNEKFESLNNENLNSVLSKKDLLESNVHQFVIKMKILLFSKSYNKINSLILITI